MRSIQQHYSQGRDFVNPPCSRCTRPYRFRAFRNAPVSEGVSENGDEHSAALIGSMPALITSRIGWLAKRRTRSRALPVVVLALAALCGLATPASAEQVTYPPLHDNQWYRMDELEAFRNHYGTIVVKQPDVWGQSRIMQHRQEFEREMASQLTNFAVSLQGSRHFTEQTAFGNAFGIGTGLGGVVPLLTGLSTNASSTQATVPPVPTNALISMINNMLASVPLPPNNVQSFGPNANIQLDPDVALDQQAEYIKHLQELRRINEGDDTADAAGYSLYLLRVPVSVDPGQKTRKGYGAEVTLRVVSETDPNLLSKTFPRLVINDVGIQLSLALTPLVNSTNLADLYRTVTNTLVDPPHLYIDSYWVSELVAKLLVPSGPEAELSKYLTNSLSAASLEVLRHYSGTNSKAVAVCLTRDLNRIAVSGDSSPLTEDDITNLAPIVKMIRQPAHSDRISRYLRERLSATLTNLPAMLDAYSTGSIPALTMSKALIDGLNGVISQERLYNPERFAGVSLSRETLDLLQQNPSLANTNDLRWLNRLLLVDAYPEVLARTRPVFAPSRFVRMKLSEGTIKLLRNNVQGADLARLNCLLLLDAYTNELYQAALPDMNSAMQNLLYLRNVRAQKDIQPPFHDDSAPFSTTYYSHILAAARAKQAKEIADSDKERAKTEKERAERDVESSQKTINEFPAKLQKLHVWNDNLASYITKVSDVLSTLSGLSGNSESTTAQFIEPATRKTQSLTVAEIQNALKTSRQYSTNISEINSVLSVSEPEFTFSVFRAPSLASSLLNDEMALSNAVRLVSVARYEVENVEPILSGYRSSLTNYDLSVHGVSESNNTSSHLSDQPEWNQQVVSNAWSRVTNQLQAVHALQDSKSRIMDALTNAAAGASLLQNDISTFIQAPSNGLAEAEERLKDARKAKDDALVELLHAEEKVLDTDSTWEQANAKVEKTETLLEQSRDTRAQARTILYQTRYEEVLQVFGEKLKTLNKLLQPAVPRIPSGRFSRSPFAFPNNEVADLYGPADVVLLAQKIRDDLGGAISSLELQKYLLENLQRAYGLLVISPVIRTNTSLQTLCQDVSTLSVAKIEAAHNAVSGLFHTITNFDSVAPLLVWPIALESALLAHELQERIQSTGEDMNISDDPLLLRPSYSIESAFKSFVKRRWPVHVFALDPTTQDQNIADSSSLRRSLQLSFAFAIATGKINASDQATYSKLLGLDLDAIYLNHTIVAFSDGADTFGWRFLPRFSTNGKLKSTTLKGQAIDRGERECTAFVVLPSFVPAIQLETRTRWFGLDCPTQIEPKLERMYHLSEQWRNRIDNYRHSFLLAADNIAVEKLCLLLKNPSAPDSPYPISTNLTACLSGRTRSLLYAFNTNRVPDRSLRTALPIDLNRIIGTDKALFSIAFASTNRDRLSRRTIEIGWKHPEYGPELAHLNCLVLQEVYPQGIIRGDFDMPSDRTYLWADRDKSMRLLDDLRAALPLQSLPVGLPYETAIGGFTLFSDEGVTFLGPDLYGFEGTPVTDGTNDFTVYLQGNNFSVRGAQVIASGTPITNFVLLSRQLMQATIPGSILKNTNQVEVLVATPYGVSSPIFITPTYTGKAVPASSKSGYTWQVNAASPTSYSIQVGVVSNRIIFPPIYPDANNPYPHIVRQLGNGTDANLLPQSGSLNFKVTLVTDLGTSPLSDANNRSVLQITNNAPPDFKFQFANNEMVVDPTNFCQLVWPQITNFVGNKLDRYCASNGVPSNFTLRLATYLRLSETSIIQTDEPLMLPLTQ